MDRDYVEKLYYGGIQVFLTFILIALFVGITLGASTAILVYK